MSLLIWEARPPSIKMECWMLTAAAAWLAQFAFILGCVNTKAGKSIVASTVAERRL